ncbi:hypothetical protein ACHAXT_001105 [Thalassiosira profunda]
MTIAAVPAASMSIAALTAELERIAANDEDDPAALEAQLERLDELERALANRGVPGRADADVDVEEGRGAAAGAPAPAPACNPDASFAVVGGDARTRAYVGENQLPGTSKENSAAWEGPPATFPAPTAVGVPMVLTASGGAPAPDDETGRGRSKRRKLIALAVLLVAIAAILVGVLFSRPDEGASEQSAADQVSQTSGPGPSVDGYDFVGNGECVASESLSGYDRSYPFLASQAKDIAGCSFHCDQFRPVDRFRGFGFDASSGSVNCECYFDANSPLDGIRSDYGGDVAFAQGGYGHGGVGGISDTIQRPNARCYKAILQTADSSHNETPATLPATLPATTSTVETTALPEAPPESAMDLSDVPDGMRPCPPSHECMHGSTCLYEDENGNPYCDCSTAVMNGVSYTGPHCESPVTDTLPPSDTTIDQVRSATIFAQTRHHASPS